MGKSADTILEQFDTRLVRQDSLVLRPVSIHEEEPDHLKDIIALKYLADAGIPEARLKYARFCNDGKYVHQDRKTAFEHVSKLLTELPIEGRKKFIEENMDDGLVGQIIAYQYAHQYGTAHAHKWWSWGNQVRLNFTRMTIIARQGALDLIRKNPGYASLAFGIFFLRIFYDLGVFLYSFIRDAEKRNELNKDEAYKGHGDWEWFKRFVKKDGRPLRYANDIVWAALGITGFVLDMVGIGGYAAAVPLVVGFLFDVGVELYRAIKLYQSYSQEITFLHEKITECENQIAALRAGLQQEHSPAQHQLRRKFRAGVSGEERDQLKRSWETVKQNREADESKLEDLIRRLDQLVSRKDAVELTRRSKAQRSAFIVTATALLFVGMFLGRIIPLAFSVDPIIGLSIVFAASAAILLHKLVESIHEFRQQKLKEKIHNAGSTYNEWMYEYHKEKADAAEELERQENDDISRQESFEDSDVSSAPPANFLVKQSILDATKKQPFSFFRRKKPAVNEYEIDFDSADASEEDDDFALPTREVYA